MSDQQFEAWKARFERSKKGKAALISLDDDLAKYGSEKNYWVIQRQILWECYQAHQYNENQIRDLLQKKRDYKKLVIDQIKAIKAVGMFANKYPGESAVAINAASTEIKKQFKGVSFPRDGINWAKYLSELMDQYAKRIKITGPFVSLRVGPLLYPKNPLTHTNLPELSIVGLLLHLVILFRDWTANGEYIVQRNSRIIPTHGRPCYKQAALFVSATLSENLSTSQASDRIKKLLKNNPGIKSGFWPVDQI